MAHCRAHRNVQLYNCGERNYSDCRIDVKSNQQNTFAIDHAAAVHSRDLEGHLGGCACWINTSGPPGNVAATQVSGKNTCAVGAGNSVFIPSFSMCRSSNFCEVPLMSSVWCTGQQHCHVDGTNVLHPCSFNMHHHGGKSSGLNDHDQSSIQARN